jgi:asparagine synthetase B (glutamine-hydrolysing)
MKLLFGLYGENVVNHQESINHYVDQYEIINRNCIISNINSGRIKYPPSISDHEKWLFLNGLFILKDYTLDAFMDNPLQILHSILKKSPGNIPKEFVNGAYNGVILEKDGIYLFNDFMALYPLYYSFRNGVLFFSSNLQLLSKILKPAWDKEAITEFLQLGYNFTYRTILKDIFCLPPSSLLSYKNNNLTIKNYASFPETREVTGDQQEVIEEIHSKFKKSVNRLYSTKLKYCLSLTGGMDSRLIFLEWPDRSELLTETAGENSSDFIKARELVEKLGNADLHELEDLKDDMYFEGIQRYYDLCDNPTKLLADYNYFHLLWKQNRGADIHFTGVGGELYNGESLYLNRKLFCVLSEGILPYHYHKLDDASKANLIKAALYSKYKRDLSKLLSEKHIMDQTDIIEIISEKLDTFLGNPSFKETYIERFRTFMLANAAYYPLSFVNQVNDFLMFPYNDREFIYSACKYHPASRELRRLQLSILKKHKEALDIPIDTTHIKVSNPYFIHKFMRVLRFVLNIGFHKKIPFIQKGDPPKFRVFKYFDHSFADYRNYVKSLILESSFYNRNKTRKYLQELDKISRFNFYTHHKEAANISILLRLAIAEKKFK